MSGNKPRMSFGFGIDNQEAREDDKPSYSSSGQPLHIAILGDFSARDNGDVFEPETINKRRLYELDRDNIEELLQRFDITLSLRLSKASDASVNVPLRHFDDFHPDELYQNIEVFDRLRALRARLRNNNTFHAAVAEMQGWIIEAKLQPRPEPVEPGITAEDIVAGSSVLDSVLNSTQTSSRQQQDNSTENMVDRLVKEIVAPYVESKADPRQPEMVAAVDTAISDHMRSILHHPEFQSLEAAWLALEFLISRVETHSKLKLFIMDVSKRELQADLAQDDIAACGLYRKFCDLAQGESAPALLIGNYRFSDSIEDVLLLSQIGTVAQQAGSSFIAAADEKLFGCVSLAQTPDVDDWAYELSSGFSKAWSMLRESPVAGNLALAAPGFLLRQPYGKSSRPIESFSFEEIPGNYSHHSFLWGNAAFIKAEQIARAFARQGWSMNPAQAYETANLPLYFYVDEGDKVPTPTAEILLSERGGDKIRAQGLNALCSVKSSDSIRSGGFYSLAADDAPLALFKR